VKFDRLFLKFLALPTNCSHSGPDSSDDDGPPPLVDAADNGGDTDEDDMFIRRTADSGKPPTLG